MRGEGRERRRTGNLLHHLIAISVAVMFMAVILGVYLGMYFSSTSYHDFLDKQEIYLSGVQRSHENELQIFKDIATQMELSGNAQFLLGETPVKSAQLKEQLYQYRSVNQFYTVLFSCYQKDHYLFNHITSLELDAFCNKGFLFEHIQPSSLRDILKSPQRRLFVVPEGEIDGEMYRYYSTDPRGSLYILPVPPDFSTLLLFIIPGTSYDSLLAETEGGRSTYLLYDGKVIASRGEGPLFPEAELLRETASGEGQRQVRLDGTRYLLTQRESPSGFTYITLQTMQVYSAMQRGGLSGILGMLLLCCIPTALVLYLVSRRMLRQVSSISSILQNEQQSERYDMDVIESGVRSLVENTRSMKEDTLELRKNSFVRVMLRSGFADVSELEKAAQGAEIQLSNCYMVGILGSHSDTNEQAALQEILAYVHSSEDLDGYAIRLFNTNQQVMLLFSQTEERLYTAYEEILTIGRRHCDAFVVAVSWHHTDLMIGSLAYIEANNAYDNRFLMDNDHILLFRETRERVDMEQYREMRKHYIGNMERIIRMGNQEATERAIRELCDAMQQEHASILSRRLLADEVLRMLMAQWKGEEKQWDEVYNVFTFSRCLNMEEFGNLLVEACHMLMSEKTNAVDEQSRLSSEAIARMRQKFGSPDLTISALADELGISSVTLAVEFKNETGMSPSDYLAALRLDEAKRLLLTTNMMVKEISQQVGYEDEHVFIRRFKKDTGKTPGQYRKDNL